ncbi:hypothetical protein [Nocardioides sp. Leaf285]|uniref:hypothetical protein n=1 Tax=Nocardioides sp. Leaf285 TaxID=1736322 RepID=UPI0012EA2217
MKSAIGADPLSQYSASTSCRCTGSRTFVLFWDLRGRASTYRRWSRPVAMTFFRFVSGLSKSMRPTPASTWACCKGPGSTVGASSGSGCEVEAGAATSSAASSLTGSADTGSADTGSADTGSADTGSADTGSADTGSADTGSAARLGGADCSGFAPSVGATSAPGPACAADVATGASSMDGSAWSGAPPLDARLVSVMASPPGWLVSRSAGAGSTGVGSAGVESEDAGSVTSGSASGPSIDAVRCMALASRDLR